MKWALFILLMYYTLCASAQNSTVIRCAYQNSNNFPFQLGSGSQIHKGKPGIAVEMVLMLEQRLDIEIELLRLPWKRAEQRLKEGEVDCLFNASFKKNRLANGQYPMHEGEVDVDKRSYFNSYAIFALEGGDLVWNGDQLLNHRTGMIGAERGFSVIADLKAMGVNIYQANSIEQLMKLVKHQRLVGAAVFELLGEAFLNVNRSDYLNIKKLSPSFKKKAYYLMLSHQFVKDSPELANQLWTEIAIIRESQAFKLMLEKYLQ